MGQHAEFATMKKNPSALGLGVFNQARRAPSQRLFRFLAGHVISTGG